MVNIKEGDAFPEFSLLDDSNNIITLSSLRGKKSVIYFYPKDNTPGCTKEACSFRDNVDKLKSMGVNVVGIRDIT